MDCDTKVIGKAIGEKVRISRRGLIIEKPMLASLNANVVMLSL
jgi:hypothetical protein